MVKKVVPDSQISRSRSWPVFGVTSTLPARMTNTNRKLLAEEEEFPFPELSATLLRSRVDRRRAVRLASLRASWTAMSFSSSWLQRLSIAMGKEAAIATLRRTQVRSRQRVLASGESGDFESWTEG